MVKRGEQRSSNSRMIDAIVVHRVTSHACARVDVQVEALLYMIAGARTEVNETTGARRVLLSRSSKRYSGTGPYLDIDVSFMRIFDTVPLRLDVVADKEMGAPVSSFCSARRSLYDGGIGLLPHVSGFGGTPR